MHQFNRKTIKTMLKVSKTTLPNECQTVAPWYNFSDEQRAAFFTTFNKALADQFRRIRINSLSEALPSNQLNSK